MRKTCKVTYKGDTFVARCGDLLLDRALASGVDLPHDCRSGACGTCRMRVVHGKVFGGNCADGDGILACQARVVSDLEIASEDIPHPVTVTARVAALTQLAPDITGVRLDLERSLDFRPGQYCKVQFRGFPARCYSPTYPLTGAPVDGEMQFHVRTVKNGSVSSALGGQIRPGHRVRVMGPYGSAWLRPNHTGRTILVASGTGFAPMWSVAVAAITEQPRRPLLFVVAARTLRAFYMHEALCRLALFPNVAIIPVVSAPQDLSPVFRRGRPTDHLPQLLPDDAIYTAGAPAMTEAVARMARAAGARCHTDPFTANAVPDGGLDVVTRLVRWLDRQKAMIGQDGRGSGHGTAAHAGA